jgi:hexokinase
LCRHETGEIFAVDIGGTNFRVIYVKLSDEKGLVVGSGPFHTTIASCTLYAFVDCLRMQGLRVHALL